MVVISYHSLLFIGGGCGFGQGDWRWKDDFIPCNGKLNRNCLSYDVFNLATSLLRLPSYEAPDGPRPHPPDTIVVSIDVSNATRGPP